MTRAVATQPRRRAAAKQRMLATGRDFAARLRRRLVDAPTVSLTPQTVADIPDGHRHISEEARRVGARLLPPAPLCYRETCRFTLIS